MLEILSDRGYPIDQLEIKKDDFEPLEGEKRLELQTEKDGRKIMVLWFDIAKLGGPKLCKIAEQLTREECFDVIIIVGEETTPWGEGLIRNLRQKGTSVDVYSFAESQFNLMKHEFVPKQRICSTCEKEKVMSDYSVTSGQLPHITFGDPVVRHLGAKKGDLIKVVRKSEAQQGAKVVSYRLVV